MGNGSTAKNWRVQALETRLPSSKPDLPLCPLCYPWEEMLPFLALVFSTIEWGWCFKELLCSLRKMYAQSTLAVLANSKCLINGSYYSQLLKIIIATTYGVWRVPGTLLSASPALFHWNRRTQWGRCEDYPLLDRWGSGFKQLLQGQSASLCWGSSHSWNWGLSDAKTRAACSDILTYTELGTCHCAEKGFCQWTQKLPNHFCQGSCHAFSNNSF